MGQTGTMSESLPEPSSYAATLVEIKQQVHAARFTAQRRANTELVELYWRIGQTIAARQASEGWGAKVIGRLASDLRAAFPEMKGFSPRNLTYMRTFAAAWTGLEIAQQAVARLPWLYSSQRIPVPGRTAAGSGAAGPHARPSLRGPSHRSRDLAECWASSCCRSARRSK